MVQKITLQERELLFKLLCEKESVANIAQKLGRNKSTIYRELKRLSQKAYSPATAQAHAILKSKNSRKKEKFQNKDLQNPGFKI